MDDGFRDPIFRGCTRPAMLAGVPIVPMLIVCGLSLLLATWTFYFVSGYLSLFIVLMAIPLVVTMREMTTKDDQRLRQMMIRVRMRAPHMASRMTWGAISYGPLRFKSRSI